MTPTDRPIVPGLPLKGTDLLRLAAFFAKRKAPQNLRADAASAFVVEALKAAPRARLDGRPVAFLVRSGIGGMLNLVRRERRHRAASLDADLGAGGDGFNLADTLSDARTPHPDGPALAREKAAMVRAAVDSLPLRERAVAVAVLLDGRAGADVADGIGRTPQAVYLRLGRARRMLRERLAECAP